MIQGVNFVTSGDYTLTYKRMLQGVFALFLFLCVLYLFQIGRLYYAKHRIRMLEDNIKGLTIAKEKQLAVVKTTATVREANSVVKEVYRIIGDSPDWPSILKDISQAMPAQTWLSTIKAEGAAQGEAAKKLILNGSSYGAGNPMELAVKLGKSAHLKSVSLKSSIKDNNAVNLYTFVIEAEIVTEEK